jgi:endonuclease-8
VHDVAIVATDAEGSLVGHLGPDLLGPDWDAAEAVRRLVAQPDRTIGEALLDQRNLAGIGNLYKAEALFLSGLHPWRRVGDVDDLTAVVRRTQALLHANKDRWPQVTTGNTRKGEELYVFERPRLPCRRCGTPISVDMQGDPPYDRLTYWCPACQPMR